MPLGLKSKQTDEGEAGLGDGGTAGASDGKIAGIWLVISHI